MNDEFFDGFGEWDCTYVRRNYFNRDGKFVGSHPVGSNLPGCPWFMAPYNGIDGYVVDTVNND